MQYSIENVQESTKEEAVCFLKRHEEYSLFLLGNLEVHGYKRTDAPYSGNYKIIRSSGCIIGVYYLSGTGTLLITLGEHNKDIFEKVIDSLREEAISLKGVIGDWEYCAPLWSFIQDVGLIQEETFVSKEILYQVDVSQQEIPAQPHVRLLTPEDYVQWSPLHQNYAQELGLTSVLDEAEKQKEFIRRASQNIVWGLFLEEQLVSVAELNAKALDLGQVGGVYTAQPFRRRGFSKAVMRQVIRDAKVLHSIRKLIIFTDVENFPARSVYESLHAQHIGYFALLFGR